MTTQTRKANAAANRALAKTSGAKTYKGMPCRHGHKGMRYTSTNICVECQRAHDVKKVKGTGGLRPAVVEPYTEEQIARLNSGALKYFGAPCPKGHDGLRYTRNNVCVDCSKEKNQGNRAPVGLSRSDRAKWRREQMLERKRKHEAAVRQILANVARKDLPEAELEEALLYLIAAC